MANELIAIIGAGIAGLSAGCYSQMNGQLVFDWTMALNTAVTPSSRLLMAILLFLTCWMGNILTTKSRATMTTSLPCLP